MDRQIKKITPNEGGVVKEEQILCRELLIDECWKLLLIMGIVFAAERRFGKSSILRKMHKYGKQGFITIYKQVEGIKSIEIFVTELYEACKEQKLFEESIIKKIDNYWTELSIRVKSDILDPEAKYESWRKKLKFLIQEVINQNPNSIFVIMLDEFSLMLDSLSPEDAAEVIGYLRSIVHDTFPDNLRFIYSGSIGIDLILKKIESKGINLGDPLNHMKDYNVEPFSKADTEYFCSCLAAGCGIKIDDAITNEIYELTEGIPYFIDKIFIRIRYKEIIDENLIREVYSTILDDQHDDSNLDHFFDRINTYYLDKELATNILNYLSKKDELVKEQDIIKLITNTIERKESEIKEKLNKLWKDGYLKRVIHDGRSYKFKYTIIKNWWSINKA